VAIHPSALVSPRAQIDADVHIGPLCIIEDDVTIGAGCTLEAGVVVKSGVVLGTNNHVFEGAVIGGPPQHVHMPAKPGRVIIGSGNVIRENVTIHRALQPERATIIGNNNLLMCNAHIAHDCQVGNNSIIVNNVMLAGHVIVEDRAYLSGAAAVHQFCRIGTLAMVGGQAHINKDVPPFVTVDGLSSYVVGLNTIGLRRAGFDAQTIARLKAAYRAIYRSGLSWAEILERLRTEFNYGPAAEFYRFLSTTARGIVPQRRDSSPHTIKLPQAEDYELQAGLDIAKRAAS